MDKRGNFSLSDYFINNKRNFIILSMFQKKYYLFLLPKKFF